MLFVSSNIYNTALYMRYADKRDSAQVGIWYSINMYHLPYVNYWLYRRQCINMFQKQSSGSCYKKKKTINRKF